jgi:hypothetical protein
VFRRGDIRFEGAHKESFSYPDKYLFFVRVLATLHSFVKLTLLLVGE